MIIQQEPEFKKAIKHIKDNALKEKVKKQIKKIIENPEIGDFLGYEKRGERKIYIKPFRLLYYYNKQKEIITFINFKHRGKIYRK
ncbi:MAG: hypothetical protein CMH63_00790 [Nanoarchaeota archaeon]|jgi:mRNA-degrading endonuclease RelE of RelBE toxin-antitoxin system|nr:hypothetical protein [Nanoarchaeota archaeon]|tara:strand:+ start:2554 stop:2808 length:255 start_codon:yes stop_codon:yes gene_type:complete